MANYEVKKVPDGIEQGKWGVYKDGKLQKAFHRKGSATRDMKRRKAED